MSTAPSDSVSNLGKKKNRPGKNARQAAKAASTVNSDSAFFSSQLQQDPVPQPGSYPVVFRTGVGEPTRDVEFSYDGDIIADIVDPLAERYIFNPRYAEFSSHSDYTDDLFEADIQRQVFLGLAQQTVHAHVNMGLPLGDFSSIASSDVYQFTSLAAVVRQFGEFSDPSLGTRYLLCDYPSTVFSLVRAAKKTRSEHLTRARKTMWLPTRSGDKRTKFILGTRLVQFVAELTGALLDLSTLCDHLFDSTWPTFEALKPQFGDTAIQQDRFDFLFTSWGTEVQFVQKFTGNGPQGVLHDLGLWWDHPVQPDLAFDMIPKVEFPELVDQWARKRAAVQKFVSCSSGLANRGSASGSQAQVSQVSTRNGVSVVKTHVALSAQELSLLACFPPSGMIADVGPYNVIITTSIPLQVRATEFLQGDWLG